MPEPSEPNCLKRGVQLIFKVTPAEKQQLTRGAALAGVRRSEWIRTVMLREVDRLVAGGGLVPDAA